MITIQGLWWPDNIRASQVSHSLKHLTSLDWAIAHCRQHRSAIQAGGNIGLWPRRLAESFQRVISFEPDDISRACLIRNVPETVAVRREALGEKAGWCAMARASLGSHQIVEDGSAVRVITIDSLGLTDLDLLQLDIEGYEWHALSGAVETIQRCKPLIQVELRNFTAKYGKSDHDVRALLGSFGYRQVSAQPGNDYVFEVAA